MAAPRRDIATLRVLALLRGDRRGAAAALGIREDCMRKTCERYRTDGLLNIHDEPTAAGLAALHYDDVRHGG